MGGSPRSATSRQILPLWLLKCGLTARKIAKIGNFWYICAQKGYIRLIIFYRIWRGRGAPRSPQSRQLSPLWILKCVLTAAKIAKNSNFWCKFSPKKKSRGSIQKLEYRCTTRNLPLCNGTIIVLKFTLLHGVSVITNCVIPKRDINKTNKKERKKHQTFSSTASARPTIPTILGMVIEEVCPIFAPPPTFFDPISSFAAMGLLKICGKMPHRGKMLITWVFVPRK